MEKTIYNLEPGDRYWTIENGLIFSRTLNAESTDWLGWAIYRGKLERGEVFLTEEECEQYKEKKKAFVKIKKYANELGIEEEGFMTILTLAYGHIGFTNILVTVFFNNYDDRYKKYFDVIDKFPEEVELILGVR